MRRGQRRREQRQRSRLAEREPSAPYYVKVRIKALGSTPPPSTDDPDITFDAIDDRGQQQESITFFGTFQRCDDATAPKPFKNGKSYQSCLAYLMPGGGSIRQVQRNDGPAAAEADGGAGRKLNGSA